MTLPCGYAADPSPDDAASHVVSTATGIVSGPVANPNPSTPNPSAAPDPATTAAAAPVATPTESPVATLAPGAADSAGCGFGVVACAAPPTPAAAVPTANFRDPAQLSGPTSLDELAAQTAQGAREILEDTYGSWLNTPSLSAGADSGLGLQALMLGLAATGLTLVAIWQGIRLMITRRGAVLAELVRGLMIAAVVTAAGIAVVDSALLAGDQIAAAVLARGFENTDALVSRMGETLLGTQVTDRAPVLVLLFALMVLLLGIAQAVFLVLRQIAVPLLVSRVVSSFTV